MSPRRITLSTVGVLPALERLATEPLMPNLAISLHATTEEQRDLLVPINRKYGLKELLDACRRFPLKRRERITFEYVLLQRRQRHAGRRAPPGQAAERHQGQGQPAAAQRGGRHPVRAAVRRSREPVRAHSGGTRRHVSVRKSRGRDIRAACGQLITESTRAKAPGRAVGDVDGHVEREQGTRLRLRSIGSWILITLRVHQRSDFAHLRSTPHASTRSFLARMPGGILTFR